MKTKVCSKCGTEKPLSNFYFTHNKFSRSVVNGKIYNYKSKKSYRYSYCNACRQKQSHRWYKKWKASIKEKIVKHYTRGKMACQCCGYKGLIFLTIDHRNGDGSVHRHMFGNKKYLTKRTGHLKPIQNQLKFYRWIIKNNYPSDLQVLCYNCNCAKGQMAQCPHELLKKGVKMSDLLAMTKEERLSVTHK